jgi:hypothetical protein
MSIEGIIIANSGYLQELANNIIPFQKKEKRMKSMSDSGFFAIL